MFCWWRQNALGNNIIHKSSTRRVCVCVVSCDICIELPLLSAQWSCEFNLSAAINLSTAGCCPPVWFVIRTWSLTSIYVGDKRAVTELSPKYGGLSSFLPFLIESLLLTPSFISSADKKLSGSKGRTCWPAVHPRLPRLFCQHLRFYRMFGALEDRQGRWKFFFFVMRGDMIRERAIQKLKWF